ncbi:class I SAM-dependent methyltransferase [Wolbachia endosymbiont of Tettigetta isshikii]|uniref:class I SAM-dependent methyltransferase n=1 Tax=Wolbachia endosymbiont of Tettigetta isshikii TaxID=3239093 RepID=UPI00397FE172
MLTYIHKLIDKNQGSISISDFMNAALYHKEYGYYMSKLPLGKDGDFITAPEISQLFGEIIAVWVMHTWEKLGRPSKFSLVELGPGKGTLIHDIIRVTKKYNNFFDSVSIHLIEISPALQEIQKKKLKGLDINWHKNIDSLPKRPTIFLANEFFDALPIDQFVYRNGEWYENRIVKQDNGVSAKVADTWVQKKDPSATFLSSPLSLSSKVANTGIQFSMESHQKCLFQVKSAYFYAYQLSVLTYNQNYWIPVSSTGMTPPVTQVTCKLQRLHNYASSTGMINKKLFDGAVVEVCPAGIEILKRLEKKVYNNKGAALIIDYGYVYPKYKSTLQSVKQHKYANFLENVGNSDITALVNFQALRDSLEYVDCEILTQREFLYLFGIKERTQALIKNASDEQKNRIFSEFLRLTENMGTLFKAMLIHHL